MSFTYARRGGPLLDWSKGYAPPQSRASSATAMGCACHGKPKGKPRIAMGDAFRTHSPEPVGLGSLGDDASIPSTEIITPAPAKASAHTSIGKGAVIGGVLLVGVLYMFKGK